MDNGTHSSLVFKLRGKTTRSELRGGGGSWDPSLPTEPAHKTGQREARQEARRNELIQSDHLFCRMIQSWSSRKRARLLSSMGYGRQLEFGPGLIIC